MKSEVSSWWNALSFADKMAVQNGFTPVYVMGHADTKGSRETNLRISKKRAQVIANLIGAEVGSKIKLLVAGKGEAMASAYGLPQGRSNQNWRRVSISICGPY